MSAADCDGALVSPSRVRWCSGCRACNLKSAPVALQRAPNGCRYTIDGWERRQWSPTPDLDASLVAENGVRRGERAS